MEFVFSSNPAELSIPAALLPKDTFVTLSFVILESPRLAGFGVCACLCVLVCFLLDTTQLQPSFWPHYFTLHPSPLLPTPHNRHLPSLPSSLFSGSLGCRPFPWLYLSPSLSLSMCFSTAAFMVLPLKLLSCSQSYKIFCILTHNWPISSRLKSPVGFQQGVKCKDFSRKGRGNS